MKASSMILFSLLLLLVDCNSACSAEGVLSPEERERLIKILSKRSVDYRVRRKREIGIPLDEEEKRHADRYDQIDFGAESFWLREPWQLTEIHANRAGPAVLTQLLNVTPDCDDRTFYLRQMERNSIYFWNSRMDPFIDGQRKRWGPAEREPVDYFRAFQEEADRSALPYRELMIGNLYGMQFPFEPNERFVFPLFGKLYYREGIQKGFSDKHDSVGKGVLASAESYIRHGELMQCLDSRHEAYEMLNFKPESTFSFPYCQAIEKWYQQQNRQAEQPEDNEGERPKWRPRYILEKGSFPEYAVQGFRGYRFIVRAIGMRKHNGKYGPCALIAILPGTRLHGSGRRIHVVFHNLLGKTWSRTQEDVFDRSVVSGAPPTEEDYKWYAVGDTLDFARNRTTTERESVWNVGTGWRPEKYTHKEYPEFTRRYTITNIVLPGEPTIKIENADGVEQEYQPIGWVDISISGTKIEAEE